MAVVQIAVVKGGDLIEVDTDKLPEHVYEWVVQQGLKHFVNTPGMSRVTKAAIPDDEARKAEAMEIAQKNVESLYAGTIKAPAGQRKPKGAAAGKGKVTTLARQEARLMVKAEAKRQGIKVAHLEAKDITAYANALLEDPEIGPTLFAKAEAKLAEMEAATLEGKITFAVSARKVKQDQEKTARAKAAKEEDEPAGLSVPKNVPQAHVISAQRPTQPGMRR